MGEAGREDWAGGLHVRAGEGRIGAAYSGKVRMGYNAGGVRARPVCHLTGCSGGERGRWEEGNAEGWGG